MNNTPVITQDSNGLMTISIQCNAGVLHADMETRGQTPHNAIYIRFTPIGKNESIDIACARDIDNSRDLDVKLWADPSTEDPTIEAIIYRTDVDKAIPDD